MKRVLLSVFAVMFPVVLFAQMPFGGGDDGILKRMNLSDAQITQVQGIVKATETTIRDDMVHLRLLRAQIDDAILPSTAKPDMDAIDKIVDQESQLRGDMEKAFLSAEVQLIGIMGRDDFEQYSRFIRAHMGFARNMNGARGWGGGYPMMHPQMTPPPGGIQPNQN